MKHTLNGSLAWVMIAPWGASRSCQFQPGHDALRRPLIFLDAIDDPGDCLTQCFSIYRSTGLPDGGQTFEGPRTRTALPQLTHEQTVR